MGAIWEEHSTQRTLRKLLQTEGRMRLDQSSAGLITGRVSDDDIPPVTCRTVRIFICSTGDDSTVERTFFVDKVYLRLREYCREQYGLEFQAVDLTWGIDPEVSAADRNLPSMKIQEILKCQAQSAGPSFVAFIGQKYGPRPLPSSIAADEYEVIRVALHAHRTRDTRNAAILDQWYVIDENAVPSVYVIKAPADVIPDLKAADLERRIAAEAQWKVLQQEIRALLQKGAEFGYLDGFLDSDTKEKYYMSELEKEIQLGIENCDNPHKRCVLILRDIVDLKNYITDSKAPIYTEIVYNDKTEQLEVPEEMENKLLRLKNRAKGLISPSNTLSNDVLWRFDDVIDPYLHKDYLNALCEDFYLALKRLVDETVSDMPLSDVPHVVEEAMQHWSRCKNLTSDFYGREQQLQQLRDYVTGYSDRPLVLHGLSGAGKTKLVSKLALELSNLVPGNLLSLIRYVGFTPKSSDLRQVLLGLCTQITAALGCGPEDIPTEFKDLQRFFPELLASIPVDTTVVIILDALEQLLPDYNAHFMSWLPVTLPSHVKIILTTLPQQHNILQRLQNEVLKNASCFMEIQQLELEEAEGLLKHFLQSVSRRITHYQMQTFKARFVYCSLPLYVKLLSEEAKTLSSFSDPSTLQLPTDCSEGINRLLDRLEAKYGKPLVARSMSYMVASSTGLSDCEMEDLLSLDDFVLNYVFRNGQPDVRRIPPVMWLRIRQDISSFLSPRLADGVTVTVWEHDSFVSAVKKRYLSNSSEVITVHSLLADYFLGKWACRPKPVENEHDIASGRNSPQGPAADRKVPTQPLTFTGAGDEVRFNKRKYDQVPRHLDRACRQMELNTLVLFNYEWLYNKIKALSLQHIMTDFALNPTDEAALVQQALRVAAPTIERDINNLPAEITGRLLPYYTTHAHIRSLIRQCDTDGLKHCALLPNFPYQEVPGSSLQYTLECPVVGDYFGFAFDERYLLSKKTTGSDVYVFDLVTGEHKDTIFTSVGELYVTPNGHQFIIVDHVTEKSFKIHDSGSGDFLGQIIVLNHLGIKAEKYHAGPLSITNDRLCCVVTTDTSFLCIAEIPSGQMLQIVALDGKATVCQITPDGRYVFCSSNEFILSYDVQSLEHLCTVPIGNKPNSIAFTADGLRAFLSTPKENKLLVMHLNVGSVDMTYKNGVEEAMSGDHIKAVKVAPNDEHVLIHGDYHILIHERAQEKVVANFVKPDEVPKEFRLPKSHYQDLVFTNADFTRDSSYVIGAIFRNIYIWKIKSRELVTSIQAPIGIIRTLLVSKRRSQLVTHLDRQKDIHVWNVDAAVRKVDTLDKLTDAVEHVQVTEDNSIAYVKCRQSDEIGVIDMRTGAMLDLLTHDTKVQDLAITPSGHMALVSTLPRLSETATKLWDLTERKVIKEFGSTVGYCVPMHSTNSILFFSQPQAFFDTPYDISIIHFIGDTHSVHDNPGACKYIRDKPFVTYDDRFIVVSSALGYNDRTGMFHSPCLVVFDMTSSMKRTCYDASSVGLENVMDDIVRMEACPHLDSAVAVIVSCRQPEEEAEPENESMPSPSSQMVNGDLSSDRSPTPMYPKSARESSPVINNNNVTDGQQPIGFFILDVRQGCITVMCVPFLQPDPDYTLPPRLVFSNNFALCLDERSILYDLTECGVAYGQIPNPGTPPQTFALNGTVVVYFKGTMLFVVRIRDGALLARCEVHAPICHLKLCSDQRTLLVGCHDGTVASYVVVDPETDRIPTKVVESMVSRKVGEPDELDGRHSRSWDKVEVASCPAYSRPPSALSPGSRDKMILRQIKPVPRFRPKSDTLLYLNAKTSQACSVM